MCQKVGSGFSFKTGMYMYGPTSSDFFACIRYFALLVVPVFLLARRCASGAGATSVRCSLFVVVKDCNIRRDGNAYGTKINVATTAGCEISHSDIRNSSAQATNSERKQVEEER